jgi:hypothetical protein
MIAMRGVAAKKIPPVDGGSVPGDYSVYPVSQKAVRRAESSRAIPFHSLEPVLSLFDCAREAARHMTHYFEHTLVLPAARDPEAG